VIIRLTLGGKDYIASYDEVTRATIGEMRTIKRETGMTIPQLHARLLALNGRTDDDMDLYAALVYLVMCRSGETVTWAEVDAIPIVDLAAGLTVVADGLAATRSDDG
jgi:hypothetical protein